MITAAERMRHHHQLDLQQRKQEEQERLDRIVAEFNGEKMAGEILRHRHAEAQLAYAIGWMKKGAPFAMIGPGPHWRQPATIPDSPG